MTKATPRWLFYFYGNGQRQRLQFNGVCDDLPSRCNTQETPRYLAVAFAKCDIPLAVIFNCYYISKTNIYEAAERGKYL